MLRILSSSVSVSRLSLGEGGSAVIPFIRIIVLLAAFMATIGGAAAESLPDLVARIEPAVVLIRTYDCAGCPLRIGSGFFINAGGELVTGRHVLNNACKASAETSDGNKYWVARATGVNPAFDLIKLQVERPVGPTPFLEIAAALPRKGEAVVVLGNPCGYRFVVSAGIVAGFQDLSIGRTIQVTAPIGPGSSGSPVVSMSGRVVGVINLYNDSGQNINFALPARLIFSLALDTPVSLEQLSQPQFYYQIIQPVIGY